MRQVKRRVAGVLSGNGLLGRELFEKMFWLHQLVDGGSRHKSVRRSCAVLCCAVLAVECGTRTLLAARGGSVIGLLGLWQALGEFGQGLRNKVMDALKQWMLSAAGRSFNAFSSFACSRAWLCMIERWMDGWMVIGRTR
ncbi:hypothetical protein LX32DRAFT_319872 [Colletotrichum zoysiae]|uniref:Uncharacterized protein n=1 Tax=Colletotrichum zoysiae TaxID=1216348 RepID=A0AAD9HKD8_9PEZI|nr:hypothetical protein LX32DRAFT_319872 [Colletotrichum zoysiae]